MRTAFPFSRLIAGISLLVLSGCGGADLFSANSRPNSLDSSLGGNFSGFGNNAGAGGPRTAAASGRGSYARIETSFELPDVKGNPFDFTQNDVQVTFTTTDGRSVKIPAFFDGEKAWKARYTPDMTGKHTIGGISLNGKPATPERMDKREFDVTGAPQPGFVRIDSRDKTRFAFDNGNSYLPIGHNQAHGDGKTGDIEGRLEKMGRVGENWSRIWMAHFDGKNLDWVPGQKLELGTLSLESARYWDAIVESAEKAGIYFQMVLHHHGQYSTRSDANWDANPWNKKNGGFLASPEEFFTNPQAIALTKAKLRYIIARWGYSPNVLAWELFNEVEWTDSWARKHADEVVDWHNGIAKFIRDQDPYKHLVTTSSTMEVAALWENMDYLQPHAYRADALAAASLEAVKDKPIFYGEFGPAGKPDENYGSWARRALWAGLMSGTTAPPQLWHWQFIDKDDLYKEFRVVSEFALASSFISKRGLLPAPVATETAGKAALIFGPGAGFVASKRTEYTIPPSGAIEGLKELPAYFQGSAKRDDFPGATFKVNYPESGTFKVAVQQVSRAGGKLQISVDGAPAAEKDFPGSDKDQTVNETLEAKVAAGPHEIKVENTGQDWIMVRGFSLEPYAPAIHAIGRSSKDYAVLWLHNRQATPASGKLSVSGLQAGEYKARWWDTTAGKQLSEESVKVTATDSLSLTTPPINTDVALYVAKSSEKAAKKEAKPKNDPKSEPAKPTTKPSVPPRGAINP